jgi:hypothetical protein
LNGHGGISNIKRKINRKNMIPQKSQKNVQRETLVIIEDEKETDKVEEPFNEKKMVFDSQINLLKKAFRK